MAKKILVVSSTFPASNEDPVPAFVKEQIVALKKAYPEINFSVLAPHDRRSGTKSFSKHPAYEEYRFHYIWPRHIERLAGRGIRPSLQQNRLLYLEIPFFVLAEFFTLWRLARQIKPNVIYGHWFTPQAITAAFVSKLTNIPFVFTTHASDVAVLKNIPFARTLVRWVCFNSKAFTSVSERTTKRLRAFFKDSDWEKNFATKLLLIPMGTSLVSRRIDDGEIDNIIQKYGITKNKQYVLFIGRLVYLKGVQYLLEALASLDIKVNARLHLIIAGDGQYKPELLDLAEKLGVRNVSFTGFITGKDKDVIFHLADYICVPSIVDNNGDSEGFPVVIMEALTAGKIIIASDSTGGEEIIESGKNGYIFPEKSPKHLKSALTIAVQQNQGERILMQKRARVLSSNFSWKFIAKEHYKFLFKNTVN